MTCCYLQHQLLVLRHTCHHTLVTNTNECLHLSVTYIIIRRLSTRHHSEYHELLVLSLCEREVEFWYRINVSLDSLADLLCIAFCVSKTNQRVIIGNTPNKSSTHAISKGAHTLAPALRFLNLQSHLLIVFCCLTYQLANVKYFHRS